MHRLRTALRSPTTRTIALAVLGAVIGLAIAGRSQATIGPFECSLRAQPSLTGQTTVRLAPLGSLHLDTHTAPLSVEISVDELRPDDAAAIAADPSLLEDLEDELADDARKALLGLAVRAVLATLVGALAGAALAQASVRSALQGLAAGTAVAVAGGGLVVTTFRAEAVQEPEYTGLLTIAPQAVGDVASLVDRFDDYRAQLTDLVANVTTIYRTAAALPRLDPGDDVIRLLHISDIHNNPQGFDLALEMAAQFDVDLVVDTGDITDWGSDQESRLLDRVGDFEVPYVFVRGNHDSRRTQAAVAAQGGVILDGEAVEVAGLQLWGIGDRRFTPDQVDDEPETQRAIVDRQAAAIRRDLSRTDGIDVVAVHDPRAALEIGGLVPLVLAGHRHEPRTHDLDGTIVLVEGSTGGAGLRGLQDEETEPLTCSILYLDRETRRLVAYDRITVEAFGAAAARIERSVVAEPRGVPASTSTTTTTSPPAAGAGLTSAPPG